MSYEPYEEQVEESTPGEDQEILDRPNEQEVPDNVELCRAFDLELEKITGTDTRYLNMIWQWAVAKAGNNASTEDVVWQVISQRNRLGNGRVGQSTLHHFIEWLGAYEDYEAAESRLREIEGI